MDTDKVIQDFSRKCAWLVAFTKSSQNISTHAFVITA